MLSSDYPRPLLACWHGPYPAFVGTRNDNLEKWSRLLNLDVSVEEKAFGPLETRRRML
jgi:hypothetical protein